MPKELLEKTREHLKDHPDDKKAKARLKKLQKMKVKVVEADDVLEMCTSDVPLGYKEYVQHMKGKFYCSKCKNPWTTSKATTILFYKVKDLGMSRYEVYVASETYS